MRTQRVSLLNLLIEALRDGHCVWICAWLFLSRTDLGAWGASEMGFC